jgi:hypothetical protein
MNVCILRIWIILYHPFYLLCEQPGNLSEKLLKFCKNKDVRCTLCKPLISKTLALIKYQKQPITVPELLVIAARMVSNLIHLPSLHLSSSLQHDSEASVPDKEWETPSHFCFELYACSNAEDFLPLALVGHMSWL